ncbi:MAG TPA: hypothetical protein VGP61_07645 [Gemmatimonadales bacterium]|nr:hypothetical protein [Gemmatimonadales bacterium]
MQRFALLPLAVVAFAACSESPDGPTQAVLPKADPLLGRIAFEQNCATCHASRDGFDLAMFGFTDTTIIRRAVAHVDTATARNIVAYIRSVAAPHEPEKLRLFQARGAPLSDDVQFALTLFGQDEWPAGFTTADLAAIDPRTVQIAARLPVWSDESSNLDWMPDEPLPPAMLDFSGGLVAGAIAGYRAAPTRENLLRAVNALRSADRSTSNPGAPCLLDDTLRVNFKQCFEVRRWTSSLVALHLLRNGMDLNLGGQVHDVWWDVGNAARRSRADRSIPIANPNENWVAWMFLGWSFDPSQHASVYTGGGFRQLGLVRHATFIALRSQIARPRNSTTPYDDLVNAVRFAPNSWTTSVTSFGLRHLLDRLQAGDRPQTTTQITSAIALVNSAVTEASRKVAATDRPGLQTLGQQVVTTLGQ